MNGSDPNQTASEPAPGPWWGESELELGQIVKWCVGPLGFWLHRGDAEWRLAHEWDDADLGVGWKVDRSAAPPGEDHVTERFAVDETAPTVRLRPLTADRPIVVRPYTPFRVLPGHRTRVFTSSPLWVSIEVAPGFSTLRELPTKRLSDTWFGATTRAGELCYAVKTNARTSLAELPRTAYRLLTPVVIENRGQDALLVERINLPVPFLSIFGTGSGEAWSEEVHMHRTKGGEMAELDVQDGPPSMAAGAERLSAPRRIAAKGHLFHAFGSLIMGWD